MIVLRVVKENVIMSYTNKVVKDVGIQRQEVKLNKMKGEML